MFLCWHWCQYQTPFSIFKAINTNLSKSMIFLYRNLGRIPLTSLTCDEFMLSKETLQGSVSYWKKLCTVLHYNKNYLFFSGIGSIVETYDFKDWIILNCFYLSKWASPDFFFNLKFICPLKFVVVYWVMPSATYYIPYCNSSLKVSLYFSVWNLKVT